MMSCNNRESKNSVNNRYAISAGIFVVACSYFAYALYWLVKASIHTPMIISGEWFIEQGLNYPQYIRLIWSLIDYSSTVGITIRFIGAFFAVLVSYQLLARKTASISSMRGKISTILFCEGLYWAIFVFMIVLINIYANDFGLSSISNLFFTLSYSLQILLISPFLIALGLKFREPTFDSNSMAKSRLVWISFINYTAALWGNYTIRWLELASPVSTSFFMENAYFGLANSAVTLFLAVVFAVAGAFQILKRHGSPNLKWVGLSLTFLGLHFLIHIVYTIYTGVLANTLIDSLTSMLVHGDIWPVTALGLGLYLSTKIPFRK